MRQLSQEDRHCINLSKVPDCALGLTAAIGEQTALSALKQSTYLSPMYEPAPVSQITSDWQMTAECFLLFFSLHKKHTYCTGITKEVVDS